jgi:hypothetical protein
MVMQYQSEWPVRLNRVEYTSWLSVDTVRTTCFHAVWTRCWSDKMGPALAPVDSGTPPLVVLVEVQEVEYVYERDSIAPRHMLR